MRYVDPECVVQTVTVSATTAAAAITVVISCETDSKSGLVSGDLKSEE